MNQGSGLLWILGGYGEMPGFRQKSKSFMSRRGHRLALNSYPPPS